MGVRAKPRPYTWKGEIGVTPHTHISPVHILAACLGVLVVFGTLHLLALSNGDNRAARALITLGF